MTASEAIESLAGVADTVMINEHTARHVGPIVGVRMLHSFTVTTFDGEELTAQMTATDLSAAVELARAKHLKKTGRECGEWDPIKMGA